MTINYTEKRNFIRIPINHVLTFNIAGSENHDTGVCKDLSADGVSFLTEKRLDPGTIVDINITPKDAVVMPLDATIKIIRVIANESGNNYEIAGMITKMK